MKHIVMANLTWPEYHAESSSKILILPVGSTEQHGPHLPLGVDTIIATKMSEAIAERLPAIVAPPFSYGYKSQPASGGGPLFPGTIDLNGQTLVHLTYDVLTEFLDDGWQKILIFNGHYENEAFLSEAADLLLRNQEEEFPKIIIANWWDNVSADVIPKVFDQVKFKSWALEHAALVETSMMMYFAPELVRTELIPNEGVEHPPSYQAFPPPSSLVPESGCLSTAISSSPEKGELLVADVLNHLVPLLAREFGVKVIS